MILATYINDLLYRYDCVIVPDFGGFVTNRKGAKINSYNHNFTPPSKQITFNNLLKHNDGLLANYIASSENISFEKATTAISLSVIKWKNELQFKSIEIDNLGSLSLSKEKKIIFEPNLKVNYLTESFGLAAFKPSVITRNKQEIKPFIPVLLEQEKEEKKRRVPLYIKYAATAAILLTLGYVSVNSYKNKEQNNILASQKKVIEKKIQSATFVISNPLPTINLNVVKEESSKSFHVVAGAFEFADNAENKVKELKAKGYNAKVIGVNKWGLIQVAYNSYTNRKEATNNLYKIQDTVSKDAWLLAD